MLDLIITIYKLTIHMSVTYKNTYPLDYTYNDKKVRKTDRERYGEIMKNN